MSKRSRHAFTTTHNSFGEVYIYELTQELFSKIDSHTTYKKQFNKSFTKSDSFFVFCGTDSGLLVDHVLKNDIPDSTRIIFVELPEVLSWLEQNQNLKNLPQNIKVVEPGSFEKQLNFFNISSYVLQDKLYFIPSLGTQYGFYKPYTELSNNVLDYIKTLHWNIRIGLDQKDFIVGQIENLAENRIPSSVLHGKFSNCTAVLLAGGPSLNLILPWIKKNRTRIIVFAVSRIAKQLLENTIEPDFFVSVHTQPISYTVSKEMLLFSKNSVLISHAQACPKLIGQWSGKHVYMGHLFPWKSAFNGPSKDLVGPTVSHAAYDIIVKMGFKTIILGGVDLCFSQKNVTHVQDASSATKTSQAEGGDVRVETNDGSFADTTFAFQRGILEFGRLAQQAAHMNCRTINPSLNSAKIDGVEVISIEDLPLTNPTIQLDSALKSIHFSREENITHCDHLLEELGSAASSIKHLRETALHGFQTTTAKSRKKPQNKNDIIECETQFATLNDQKYQWIYSILLSYGIHFFNSITPLDSLDTPDLQKRFNFLKLYFTAVLVSADRLYKHIEKAIARVKCRREELQVNPNLEVLIEQWLQDEQPGRAQIFLDRHHNSEFKSSNKDIARLEELINRFKNECRSTHNHDVEDNTEPVWTTVRLDNLRNRIFTAYNANNIEQLDIVIETLAEDSSPEILSHLFLSKAMRCELNQDQQEALANYNRVIENGEASNPKILEDSLLRITSLSLSSGDIENAQLALQCLTDISISHMPTYADFLYRTGQKDQALGVYAEYLGKVPEDLPTMLKLGQIYKELNSREGVKMVTDYVLEREPDNQTAINLQQFLIS